MTMIRRRTRAIVINIILFWTVLVVILYVNRQPSADKTFQWTTISYQTTAKSLPEPHGVCPGLESSTKPALVVGRMSYEDAMWLEDLEQKYHLCVYTADATDATDNDNDVTSSSPSSKSPRLRRSWSWTYHPLSSSSSSSSSSSQKTTSGHHNLQTPANKGHESMAYLTFIIDNYAHIPPSGAVFIHGNRYQWHNDNPDYDNSHLLSQLNTTSALLPSGYHNLRCDWSAGTCSPKETPPQSSMETLTRAMLEHGNVRAVSDAKLPRAIVDLFAPLNTKNSTSSNSGEVYHLGRNDAIRSQCCAQFIVSREKIHQHSRDEYVAVRQWLLDGATNTTTTSMMSGTSNPAPSNDLISGRILSYIWHILFIPNITASTTAAKEGGINLNQLNKLACPDARECYCRLYGRCGLKGCTKGQCPGQYRVPPGYKVPEVKKEETERKRVEGTRGEGVLI